MEYLLSVIYYALAIFIVNSAILFIAGFYSIDFSDYAVYLLWLNSIVVFALTLPSNVRNIFKTN